MWDLPWPGIKPVSPALAGRFLTTAPPGKSHVLRYFVQTSQLKRSRFCFYKMAHFLKTGFSHNLTCLKTIVTTSFKLLYFLYKLCHRLLSSKDTTFAFQVDGTTVKCLFGRCFWDLQLLFPTRYFLCLLPPSHNTMVLWDGGRRQDRKSTRLNSSH